MSQTGAMLRLSELACKRPPQKRLLSSKVIKRFARRFGNLSSIESACPADYCYNNFNKSTVSFRHRILEQISHGSYRILGPDYPYKGDLFLNRGYAHQVLVGDWYKGRLRIRTDSIPQLILALQASCSKRDLQFPSIEDTGFANVLSIADNSNEIDQRLFSHCQEFPLVSDGEEVSPTEGRPVEKSYTHYERNLKLRRLCLLSYGCSCQICGFNFEGFYGPIGKHVIQVHHINPLGEIKEEHKVDPIKDMIPVCPNCHVMIHSRRNPCLAVDQIKEMIARKKS